MPDRPALPRTLAPRPAPAIAACCARQGSSIGRDRGSRLVRMKPDRPSVSRSVLPAAKFRDPLTKLGGDRPYGRHFVAHVVRHPLPCPALPMPFRPASACRRCTKNGWEQSLPSLVRMSDRGARIPFGSILHNMTRPAAHHPSIERIGL